MYEKKIYDFKLKKSKSEKNFLTRTMCEEKSKRKPLHILQVEEDSDIYHTILVLMEVRFVPNNQLV